MTKAPIIRTRRGREIQIQPQVLLWRKRMKQFKALKGAVIAKAMLLQGGNPNEAAKWLKTPLDALNGQSPKDLLNPRQIRRLHNVIKRI